MTNKGKMWLELEELGMIKYASKGTQCQDNF